MPIEDKIGKHSIRVYFDNEINTGIIKDNKGRELPAIEGFWFAWFAFHPETELFKADNS